MAYRYEKNQNGEEDLVIDGFEKGIADSPYLGIANIRNLNIKYYPGVAYANYKRLPATLSYGTFTFTTTLSIGAVFGTLTGAWSFPTGNYTVVFSSGETRLALFTNGSTTVGWAGAGALTQSATATITVNNAVMNAPEFSCIGDTGIKYIIDGGGQIWKQASLNSSTFNLLGVSPTTGANGSGIAFWQGYLVVFRANFIDFCGDGTGDGGVTSSNWNTSSQNTPLGNITNMVFSAAVNPTDTTATIATYTDAGGSSRSSKWFGFSGTYQLVLSSNEKINATFTNNSATVSFNTPAQIGGTATGNHVNVLTGVKHMSLVSRNDGYLYFCNGNIVSALQVPIKWAQTGGQFNVGIIPSFNFLFDALSFPATETANWLEELAGNLVIAGNFNLYQWDRLATSYQAPVPIPEQMFKVINTLNNLYIFAGYKGNIYLSNGYSISPFKKLPDYIANNTAVSVNDNTAPIDPQWQWGGIMSHRLRLYFQALAFDSATGNQLMAGIFSIGLVGGNGLTQEVPGNLVMENQNSFGLVSSTTAAGGLLIDNSILASQYDSYYSAWSNGIGGLGGIDYNDTTLYSNNEMIIETDLIPIGTFLQTTTHASMEFKMDEPMKSGDSITLYGRQHLSDTYQLIGTTTTQVLSNIVQEFPIQEGQWIQFMVTMSCNPTATASSYNRLREIRLR